MPNSRWDIVNGYQAQLLAYLDESSGVRQRIEQSIGITTDGINTDLLPPREAGVIGENIPTFDIGRPSRLAQILGDVVNNTPPPPPPVGDVQGITGWDWDASFAQWNHTPSPWDRLGSFNEPKKARRVSKNLQKLDNPIIIIEGDKYALGISSAWLQDRKYDISNKEEMWEVFFITFQKQWPNEKTLDEIREIYDNNYKPI